MQIIKVEIHNFCSIHDGSFELQDYNLLIGANNSGKSNTINAIRAFYGDISYSSELHRPLVGQSDDESWVEITFRLTDAEYTALDEVYRQPNNLLRVRRILSTAEAGRKPGLYAYEHTTLSKKVYKGAIGRIVYIPAVSKAEDQTKTTGPSPLRDVVNDILRTVTQSSHAYQQLAKSVEDFKGSVKAEQTSDGRSLQAFEQKITEALRPWGIEFLLTINPMSVDDIVKNLVRTHLKDEHAGVQEIHQFGQGLQREIIFQLIRIKSEYLEQVGDNSTELTLLLFEEPEAFLHPPQQAELAERLRIISQDNGSQVLLSSHSTHFVSYESDNISSIIRLHKDNGCSLFGQIPVLKLQAIQTDNQRIMPILQSSTNASYHPHPDDQTVDMEVIKYFMWLDPNRCGMFYAAHVLLVEGATEAVFINYLIKKNILKARPGTFVLDCLGKFNIHRFMQILSEMKVSHSVLFDDDNGKDIHPQLDVFIRSFQTAFTQKIDVLQGCIEDMLGVASKISRHRKPQHLIYLYQHNKINKAELNAFIQKVEALVN